SSESGEPPVAAAVRGPAAARAAGRTLPTRPVPIRPTVSERARCGALMGEPVLERGVPVAVRVNPGPRKRAVISTAPGAPYPSWVADLWREAWTAAAYGP